VGVLANIKVSATWSPVKKKKKEKQVYELVTLLILFYFDDSIFFYEFLPLEGRSHAADGKARIKERTYRKKKKKKKLAPQQAPATNITNRLFCYATRTAQQGEAWGPAGIPFLACTGCSKPKLRPLTQ
jgi:hypothetical protein